MDLSESELSSLSNEDYLSARAKLSRHFALTAKMIYPNHFGIQYEAYVLEKNEGRRNAKHAAKLLANLFDNFCVGANGKTKKDSKENCERLWEEIDDVVNLLRTPGQEDAFLYHVFEQMPVESQQKILLECSNRRGNLAGGDPLEKVRILMLTFLRFPKLINSHGSECLEFIIEECKNPMPKKSNENETIEVDDGDEIRIQQQCLVSLLVHEICPLLLSPRNNLQIRSEILDNILSLTIQYALDEIRDAQTQAKSGDNATVVKGGRFKDVCISWPVICNSLEEVGCRMGWELTRDLYHLEKSSQKTETTDLLWQRILTFQQQMESDAANLKSNSNQLFYTATLVFLKYLYQYVTISTNSQVMESSVSNKDIGKDKSIMKNLEEAILVEGFVSHMEDTSRNAMQHPLKRRRTTEEERKHPLITQGGVYQQKENRSLSKNVGSSSDLVEAFTHAYKYYELLRSDASLYGRLDQLIQPRVGVVDVTKVLSPRINHHATLASFYADVALYQGQFRETLQILRQIPTVAATQKKRGKEYQNMKKRRSV